MYPRTVKVRSSSGTVNEYVRVVEAYREGGKVKVVTKASKATKRRVAKAVFKLDRKTLTRKQAKMRRAFKLARLKPGKHALKLKVRPRNGKRRTVSVTLRVACR